MDRQIKVTVEKHSDGYVAYPLGLHGVVVGEGDTCQQALNDVKSAIAFHVDSFGLDPRYLSKHDFPVSARNSRAKSGSHTWSASKDRSFVGGRS